MKVYQLIYTSVRYSLSDSSLNLENSSGYRVFSCSQGLTKQEIDEIVCFSGYKKPDECEIVYSDEYADSKIPEAFPKTFRTFSLSTGKYVALQSVFSGFDVDGKDGNFFAHAFVFDETDEGFMPEDYYGSEDFKTFLTSEQTSLSLVRYLPKLSDVKEQENLGEWLDLFAKEHKVQISYLIDMAVKVLLKEEGKTHLCISTSNKEESDYYLLALKRLLPYEVSVMSGISTNNTYLPSDKQDKILFNATVSGFNNITDELIEDRKHCIYIDFDEALENENVYERLFEMTGDDLKEQYRMLGIDTPEKFNAWLMAYNRVAKQGIGKRLLQVKETDIEMFKNRLTEIYNEIDTPDMKDVKFEILSLMYDNLTYFPDLSVDLTRKYIMSGFTGIINGEPVNMESIFKTSDENDNRSELVYSSLDDIMELLFDVNIEEPQAMLLLRMFSIIKQETGISTWKEFFKNNHKFLEIFVDLCAKVIINDTAPVTFIAPIIWTNSELSEVIAYFDSSTDDEGIKKACRKFILGNIRESWEEYGITITRQEKSREDREKDILLVRKMLSSVGYVPFQRGKYQDLKFDVANDIETNDNPLLITRLLNAYYNWQMTELEPEAKQYAQEMRAIILEMREKESSCYKFIFPKLALEMLSVSGIFHEYVINTETMQDTFWNWFLIGAGKNEDDEFVFSNYERVFDKNQNDLKHLAVYKRLSKIFNER